VNENCIFCQILKKERPGRIAYEDEMVVALEDIRPHAPVHLLILPRKHMPSLEEAEPVDESLLGRLLLVAAKLARERNIATQGYRTVINNGRFGGQTVDHLHVHLLGGRVFHWPPG
jgi:histidine triad (HIT) family protein